MSLVEGPRGLFLWILGKETAQRKCCISKGVRVPIFHDAGTDLDSWAMRSGEVRTKALGSTMGLRAKHEPEGPRYGADPYSVASDQPAVSVWLCAGLTGAKLTHLSWSSATSRTAHGEYLLTAQFFFHHKPR